MSTNEIENKVSEVISQINTAMETVCNVLDAQINSFPEDKQGSVFASQVLGVSVLLGDIVRHNTAHPMLMDVVVKLVKEGRDSLPEIATTIMEMEKAS